MNGKQFYTFLHKQILIMVALSLFPGLGYIFLGWYYGFGTPTLLWYGLIIAASIVGIHLHRKFDFENMTLIQLEGWYKELSYYFYVFFALWTLIFVLYTSQDNIALHYITIFTQIGASVVASTLLVSDKKLFIPTILILTLPLLVYFGSIGEWYGYVLVVFGMIFIGVLFYGSFSSYRLLKKTNYQASHDQLTGLFNRYHFVTRLQQVINALRLSKGYSYLLLIDLDHFKTINDTLGHDIGDKLLRKVTERIVGMMEAHECVISRLGGDEFIIIGAEFDNADVCRRESVAIAEELLASLKESYEVERHHLYISASIGVSLIDAKSVNANDFIKEADIAMYEVKAKGRDGVILFNDEMSRRVEQHLKMERLLHFALEKHEMALVYQPQISPDRRVIGVEALVRWHSHELGIVYPNLFIPIAEQSGVIVELGQYILQESFKIFSQWDRQGIVLEKFSINISMRQFFHHSFVDDVTALAEKYLDESLRSKIVFELTETIVAEDIEKVVVIMLKLKQLGIRFAMDDFGTGYSSLSYLKRMPVDELKIDRSFVSELDHNDEDRAMVTTILNMAKVFHLNVVAEGVESAEQLAFLVEKECDIFQGFYFSKPLTPTEFEQFYHRELK